MPLRPVGATGLGRTRVATPLAIHALARYRTRALPRSDSAVVVDLTPARRPGARPARGVRAVPPEPRSWRGATTPRGPTAWRVHGVSGRSTRVRVAGMRAHTLDSPGQRPASRRLNDFAAPRPVDRASGSRVTALEQADAPGCAPTGEALRVIRQQSAAIRPRGPSRLRATGVAPPCQGAPADARRRPSRWSRDTARPAPRPGLKRATAGVSMASTGL